MLTIGGLKMNFASFDPLLRVIKIASPYWIIAILILSTASPVISSKGHLSWTVATEILSNFMFMFVATFIILAIYIQVRDEPYSFTELFPSSAAVAFLMSAGFLVYARSRESFGAGMGMVALFAFFAVFSLTIDIIVFIFSRVLVLILK
jgi:hypothetical protein